MIEDLVILDFGFWILGHRSANRPLPLAPCLLPPSSSFILQPSSFAL